MLKEVMFPKKTNPELHAKTILTHVVEDLQINKRVDAEVSAGYVLASGPWVRCAWNFDLTNVGLTHLLSSDLQPINVTALELQSQQRTLIGLLRKSCMITNVLLVHFKKKKMLIRQH
jgi:hypothetical protein